MASRKTSYYDTYVDGNTVRTIETLPQEEPAVRRKKRRQAKVHSAVRYKQKTRTHALYAAFLTCIMGLLVFGCVRYLQIQSRVTASMENINKLESTLNDLKAENDAEYNRVMSSVDLETVWAWCMRTRTRLSCMTARIRTMCGSIRMCRRHPQKAASRARRQHFSESK